MKTHCSFVLCLLFVLAVNVYAAANGGAAVGGWSPIKDLKDPHVVEIAEFAINEYNNRSNSHLELKSILKGETQVVAGINYRLFLTVKGEKSNQYEAIVWEKSWEGFKNLTSFKPVNSISRGGMPGGWSPIKDLKDPHVVEIAKFAIDEYNKQSKTHLELKSIVKGETQIVAGINYRLVLVVKGGKSNKYEAIVWEKPWEKVKNLTSFKPVKSINHGGIVGGWSQIKNLKDPHVVKIANFAVDEYNKQSKMHLELKSILKGETQVVTGTNYRLLLLVNGGKSNKYEATVWEKSWENFKNLTSFKPVKN